MMNFTQEQVIEASKRAPQAVKDTVEDETTTDLMVRMGQEFKLHVDQIGLMAKATTFILLGLISPEQFQQELLAAKIPADSVRSIVMRVNEQIFVPTRERLRKSSQAVPKGSPLPPAAHPASPSAPAVHAVPPPSYMPKPVAQPIAPVAAPAPRPAIVQSQPIAPGQRPAFAPLPPKTAMPQPMVAPAPRPKLPIPTILPSDIPVGITLGEPRQLKNLVQPAQPRTAPPPVNLPGVVPVPASSMPRLASMPMNHPPPSQTAPMSATPSVTQAQAPRPAAPVIPGVHPVSTMPPAPRPTPPPPPARTPGSPDPYREPLE